MTRVACTIVSANYLHFGWTLAESFLKFHPQDHFHLLLVDRMPDDLVVLDPRVHILDVEKLGIPDFQSVAFKFDILELNTGVKPSFLKYLFAMGAEKVIYFDPDIRLFHPVDLIYDALDTASIVLTPHILAPTPDREHVYERDFLNTGVFNLGFIAVSNSQQGLKFVRWWEERCLAYCYEDLRSGLFVDQKWINLVPCLFSETRILRHPGCNLAYWNLNSRTLVESAGSYLVEDMCTGEQVPLVFFHFSGYRIATPDQLSTKLRMPQNVNAPLQQLLILYGEQLKANGSATYPRHAYSYRSFSDGTLVTSLARRLYSATLDQWHGQDPFDANGRFFQAARAKGLLSKQDQSGRYSSNNLDSEDWRLRSINRILFSLLRIVGADRYTMLMKYLSFISILRNQRALLSAYKPRSIR